MKIMNDKLAKNLLWFLNSKFGLTFEMKWKWKRAKRIVWLMPGYKGYPVINESLVESPTYD